MDTIKNTLLIVDDDTTSLMVLTHILEQDYAVYVEINGIETIETTKKVMPDLILLDVLMPEITGFEVIEQLKANEGLKDIPVIFVTGKNTSEDEAMSFSLGAADYICKPFTSDVIKSRVQHQMQLINRRRELQSIQIAEEPERKENETYV